MCVESLDFGRIGTKPAPFNPSFEGRPVTRSLDSFKSRRTLTAGGKTYRGDQQLCGGYISAHDPRLHFGLGTATRIEKIVVRWPSGQTDILPNAPSDRYVTVTEGKGLF